MIRQPPAQPKSPHQLAFSQPRPPLHSLDSSSRPSSIDPAWTHPRQHRLPQQYAHPLPRNNSYPLPHHPGAANAGPRAERVTPENMLRRKTPNGVLSADYDSTAEDTVLQQPNKHILLPLTPDQSHNPAQQSNGYHPQAQLALRTNTPSAKMDYGYQQQRAQAQRQSGVYASSNRAVDGQYHPSNFPQPGSVLNHLPTHALQMQHQLAAQQFFGAVQQPLQSPAGPTVSNEQINYGPYSPTGLFIPYQPAETRDPRYMQYSHGFWPSQHPHALVNGQVGGSTYGNSAGLVNSFQAQPPFSAPIDFNALPAPVDRSYNPNFRAAEALLPYGHLPRPGFDQAHRSGILTPSGHPEPFHSPLSYQHSFDYLNSIAPVAYNSAPQTPLIDIAATAQDAEQREKIFTWAHGVYVEFLEHLQETRKIAIQNRQLHGSRQPIRPSIYPKPPRQPQYSSSSQPDGRSSRQTSLPNDSSNPSSGISTPTNIHDPNLQRHSAYRPSSLRTSQTSLSLPPELHIQHYPHSRPTWPPQSANHNSLYAPKVHHQNAFKTLRRTSGTSVSQVALSPSTPDPAIQMNAGQAFEVLSKACKVNDGRWIEGMLLAGCFAYCLGDYEKAFGFYTKIIQLDPQHVEAIANLAATYLAVDRHQEAEEHWYRAIQMRPSYFDGVEHLIGLLCSRQRGKEAAAVIEFVERSLSLPKANDPKSAPSSCSGLSPSLSEKSDKPVFDYEGERDVSHPDIRDLPGADMPGFGSSGYAVPGFENGRVVGLLHAKGNMLYSLGNNTAAAKAFEAAVLVAVGRRVKRIGALIDLILFAFTDFAEPMRGGHRSTSSEPILLGPERAVHTARLCFPPHGDLLGFKDLGTDPVMRKAAISTTSNSLLSLAKIFQDGMASNSPKASAYQSTYSVREILALYYLSLSLQPSPSTANNVGILLAGLQQAVPPMSAPNAHLEPPPIAGVLHGSGTHLALHYYNYGLNLDSRHAHLYTNLGSLLKDIGQLSAAIKMYEEAVKCDQRFDIALANLANAVKDQGRISDAIGYYKRAVDANPDFAEAVCGLANARNSVCDWSGRGGIAEENGIRDRFHVSAEGKLLDASNPHVTSSGWLKGVVDLVEKQLAEGEDWGRGTMDSEFVSAMARVMEVIEPDRTSRARKQLTLEKTLTTWMQEKWGGARLVRMVERSIRRLVWQWYQDKYVLGTERPASAYTRPSLPSTLTVPATPTVLPFHTFTSPMSAKQIRLISQRNGLRISCMTLKSAWLPTRVFPPPAPPKPFLKVGYVSSDFNNHPLAHLMQSVFGIHDTSRVEAYCYATTASDNSSHRQQIQREVPHFRDASGWSAEKLVKQIVADGIHILVNLNGYTRGARNEVFAARPAPIQMSFMGFAGTLGAEWCDYLLADETAVPLDTLRPWRRNVDLEDQMKDDNYGSDDGDWVYGENIIFCRHSFFCCDHRQSAPDAKGKQASWDEELATRWKMRRELFPNLADDTVILGNFNQLYKIDPTIFRTWLRILSQVPNAVLWLLRFPELGEANLKKMALAWAGPEVASRVLFTDVAPKQMHISRARVCDLFLDTPECNAHTTAADVLWSGTPLLTLPRFPYKMCARVAASVLKSSFLKDLPGRGADAAVNDLIMPDEAAYEQAAVKLAKGCRYDERHRPQGRLAELRRLLYESRWRSELFDTRRWVRDLESAYEVAWKRWVGGVGGDIWIGDLEGGNSLGL